MGRALDRLEMEWDYDLVPVLVDLLGHDDVGVRWQAMDLLRENAGPEHDPALRGILESPDDRAVGMAVYIAVDRWGEEGIEMARALLDHPAQLVRYDAISALMMHGGEPGRELVEEYHESGREPSEWMRRWLRQHMSEPAEETESGESGSG